MKTNLIKTEFLRTIDSHGWREPKIITFDIETILKNDIQIPYLFSMYDGKKTYSWFTDSPDLLFKELLKRKYRVEYLINILNQIYAHNLANFDLIFIFNYLANLSKIYNVNILRRDNKIIAINVSSKKLRVSLTIKDSLHLLQASLDKLSKNFNIESPKLIEPILIEDLTNNQKSVFYIQNDFSHYSKQILKINNFNNWKILIQKYCENDCVALYQILIKFRISFVSYIRF